MFYQLFLIFFFSSQEKYIISLLLKFLDPQSLNFTLADPKQSALLDMEISSCVLHFKI